MKGEEISAGATILLVVVSLTVIPSATRMLEDAPGQVTLCALTYLALFSVGLIVAGRRMKRVEELREMAKLPVAEWADLNRREFTWMGVTANEATLRLKDLSRTLSFDEALIVS